jgi:predicted O-methyltransferase YrrM
MELSGVIALQQRLGEFDFDYGPLLDRLLAEVQTGDIVVELGAFVGVSTIYTAQHFKNRSSRPYFYTIDTFGPYLKSPTGTYPLFLENIAKCGVMGTIIPIIADTSEASKYFEDNSVRYCWVDADHQYPGVNNDLKAWWPKIKKDGGIFAGHDFGQPFVKGAVEELCREHGLTCNTWSPACSPCWWIRK